MCFEKYWENGCFGEYHDIYAKNLAEQFYNAGQQSKQAEIDICEKLRDAQFEKLWSLTQAIEKARFGADEDFDLFLNHLSSILKGEQK